jgi:uncharacterized protein YggT (Ycf19 family)
MQIFLTLLSDTVFIILWVLTAAVWARVILGCVSPQNDAVPVKVLKIITEPFLYPARRLLEKAGLGGGMIDLSPALISFTVAAVTAFLPISY